MFASGAPIVRRLVQVLALAALFLAAPPGATGQAVDLQHRLSSVRVVERDGSVQVEAEIDGARRTMTPEAFARAIENAHERQDAHGFVYRVLNITTPWGFLWITVGFLGQALFTFRMLLQWIVSEREKRSVVPVGFWWGSLFGGLMLLVYFAWRRDIVGILGQSTGVFVYARNLLLIYTEPGSLSSRRDAA